jgi:predicted transposase/invertase (TIGR01784 family)
MRTDTIFYQLFQTLPSLLFELIGESPSVANSYQFSSKEVKELAFRFDGIYLPPAKDFKKFIYFVEVQFQKKKNFYWDLFGEISLYLKQYRPRQNWHAVAIFAKKSLDTGKLVQYQEYFDSGRLIRVYLDELPKVSSPSLGLGMIKLVVEAEAKAGEKARELMVQTKTQIADTQVQEKILELIDKILVYKFPQLSRQELETMFGLDDLKQTRYFQDVMHDAKLENAREDVLSVLEARFANIPSNYVPILNKIEDLSILKGLLVRAATVQNLAEFQRSLKEV